MMLSTVQGLPVMALKTGHRVGRQAAIIITVASTLKRVGGLVNGKKGG